MSTSILSTIQSRLNFYGYPICMALGNIGNIFIIIIFSRQRQNACAIYLLWSAIMNDLYLTFNSFAQIFPFYYADGTIRAFAACKIRFYLSNVLGQIAKTMIVFACIDRFIITNNSANFRALSTPKRAKIFIILAILFWPLFASHIAIMTTITNNRQCGTFGIYSTVYTIYTIIFVGFIPPLILGILGYLTYRNMRRMHMRIQPALSNTNETQIYSIRRRDRELLIIVISEVFVYVITTTAYPLILLEQMISRYVMPVKSTQYSQIESFIFTISFLLLFFNNAIPFYTYIIVSKSFRNDFKGLIINCYRKLINQPPITTTRRTNLTLSQKDTHI